MPFFQSLFSSLSPMPGRMLKVCLIMYALDNSVTGMTYYNIFRYSYKIKLKAQNNKLKLWYNEKNKITQKELSSIWILPK